MAERDPNKYYFQIEVAASPGESPAIRWFAINKNLFPNAAGGFDVNLATNFVRSMLNQPEAVNEFGRANSVRLYGDEQGDLPEGTTFNSPVGTTNPGDLAWNVDFGDFTDVNWWDLTKNVRTGGTGNGNGNGGSKDPYEPPEAAGIPGIEQQFPRGAYMAGMGGTDRSTIRGPFARYFDAQFSPTAATYMARSALGQEMLGEGDEGGQHFQTYVGSTPSGRVPGQAFAALKGMLDPQRYRGALHTPEQEMALQAFTDPQTSFQRGQAASLARAAAGGRFSPFAVANLFPGAEQVAQEWEATPQRPFLKYVAQRYGLGDLFNP